MQAEEFRDWWFASFPTTPGDDQLRAWRDYLNREDWRTIDAVPEERREEFVSVFTLIFG